MILLTLLKIKRNTLLLVLLLSTCCFLQTLVFFKEKLVLNLKMVENLRKLSLLFLSLLLY
jgi:hypothetical protein